MAIGWHKSEGTFAPLETRTFRQLQGVFVRLEQALHNGQSLLCLHLYIIKGLRSKERISADDQFNSPIRWPCPFFVKGCQGASTLQKANILFISSLRPILKRNISKWPHFKRPPPSACMPYCLWSKKLWIFSGPRIRIIRFCILGGLRFGGIWGTLSTNLSFGFSRNSTSAIICICC